MFNKDFYPTKPETIEKMLAGYDITGKIICDPEAGKGDIIDYCLANGAKEAIACEINPDLKKIVATKCKVIGEDFLKVESHQVSHIDFIIMNPPFSADEKHILHAWNIAPDGCKILSLCNLNTIENRYYRERERLKDLVDQYGSYEDLGNEFSDAERKTEVEVALIRLEKPIVNSSKNEFEGFFLEDDPEETQANGIMPFNFIRDVVQRYVHSVKCFEEHEKISEKMNNLTSLFDVEGFSFSIGYNNSVTTKNEFKKELQKRAWLFIFDKLNMQKYSTRGLKEDINKFVEKQTQIPFTMRNIYKMLEIVIGTTEQRMDKALLEVFDKLTKHYSENRYNVEGWKTNGHYLVNEKFIMPNVVTSNFSGGMRTSSYGWAEPIEDLVKALCYLLGFNYDNETPLDIFLRNLNCEWGKTYYWSFFEIKAYKKGTMHFKFQNKEHWGKFNQRIAKLKGYPLYEAVKTKETKRRDDETAKRYKPPVKAKVLFETEIN